MFPFFLENVSCKFNENLFIAIIMKIYTFFYPVRLNFYYKSLREN